jgi:hypothetical protein
MKEILTKIILILILVLVLVLMFRKVKDPEVIVETKYITITDQKSSTEPIKIEPITIKVPKPIKRDTVYDTKYDTIEKIIYKDIETKKYTYKDTLKNGVIDAEIIADNIYDRKVRLTTWDKETTITKIIPKSNLFIGASFNSNFDMTIDQATLNLYYVYKDKFILGAGFGNDFLVNEPVSNLTFAIKF